MSASLREVRLREAEFRSNAREDAVALPPVAECHPAREAEKHRTARERRRLCLLCDLHHRRLAALGRRAAALRRLALLGSLALPLRGLPLDLALLDADVLRLEPEAFRLVARGLLERPLLERELEALALEPLEFDRFELERFDPAGLDRALELAWAMLFPFLKIVRGSDVYPAVPVKQRPAGRRQSRDRCKGGGGQDTLRSC